jgi:membrane protein
VLADQAEEQVSLAASGAAFWIIISAFPIAIAAVSIFGLVVSPNQVAHDLSGLAKAGPQSVGAILTQQLTKAAAADHAGLSLGLAASVLIAVWSASRGVFNLDRAIRTAYGLTQDRFVRGRGRAIAGAFVVVIAVGITALISSALIALSHEIPTPVLVVIGVPLLLFTLGGGVAVGYRFSIGREMENHRILPGAAASAIGLVLLAVVFVTYISSSKNYSALYGALAGTVLGMIGTYLAVYVILLGAVLNSLLTQR